MPFEIREMDVASTDNIHTLKGKIYIPDGEINGILHIVHGMTEHIGRYDPLMTAIAENGYIVFGFDNLGHGRTAKNDGELGFIASNDGWKLLVKDVDAFGKAVKRLFPEKPMILMGHSMGSFIARLAFQSFPENYSKLIICGTGGKNPLAFAGLFLTNVIKLIKGEKHISKLVLNMAFGSYNNRFKDEHNDHAWLSTQSSLVEKYATDKFCSFKFTVSAMHDLIMLTFLSNKNEWFLNISKDTPILLISGEDDPVGNYGKGVRQVYNRLINANTNAKLKLYKNCRHEIHNDSCRSEVINDILDFIKA